MAAERRPVLGNISWRWVAVVVVLAVSACGIWFYYGPHALADSSGRAQTIAGAANTSSANAEDSYATSTKENTATPMIGRSTGYDGSPRPKTTLK